MITFLNAPSLAYYINYFRDFQKNITIFTTMYVSIQYVAQGFEPTTYWK